MTARLDGIKDHANLLRAFSILLETQPLATLELLGDGELRSELETLAVNLGIQERVKFRGTVSDVYAEMAHWDLFAYSTTDREGLGNALVEAMMLGLPCVVTDAGPMRELVGDPPGAVIVPAGIPILLADAMSQLLADQHLRKKISISGRKRANDAFSQERCTWGYLSEIGIAF
jgi:glycosyltransferase involved in cell wall biosynthesis